MMRAAIGTVVKWREEPIPAARNTFSRRIVPPDAITDENKATVMASTAPLARAIIGHVAGDAFPFESPIGPKIITILNVER